MRAKPMLLQPSCNETGNLSSPIYHDRPSIVLYIFINMMLCVSFIHGYLQHIVSPLIAKRLESLLSPQGLPS